MDFTPHDVYSVGKKQRAIIYLIIATICLSIIPFASLVVSAISAYFVFRLASVQKLPLAWLWALSQVVPWVYFIASIIAPESVPSVGIWSNIPDIVSIVCLAIISGKATKILRGNGIKVGFLGASTNDLDQFLNVNVALVNPVAPVTAVVVPQPVIVAVPPAPEIPRVSSGMTSSASTVADKLRTLKDLHQQNLITEGEYERRRQGLVAQV